MKRTTLTITVDDPDGTAASDLRNALQEAISHAASHANTCSRGGSAQLADSYRAEGIRYRALRAAIVESPAESPPIDSRIRTLTDEQLRALRTYARSHGRTWKAALNVAWSTGCDTSLLRQIRNAFGPVWLVTFRFDKPTTHSRTY